MPSVLPRLQRERHAVDGADAARGGQEVRLEVGDLQQRLGLGFFHGPRRGGCSAHVVLVVSFIGVPPDTVHGRHLNERSVSDHKSNAAPFRPSSPPAKHASR